MLMMMHMNQQMRLSLILLLSLVTFSCFGQVTFAQLQRLHPNEAPIEGGERVEERSALSHEGAICIVSRSRGGAAPCSGVRPRTSSHRRSAESDVDECGTVGVNNSIVWMSVGVNNFVFPYLNPDPDALRQIATTLGATLVDSTDDPCQSGKLSISTANSSTIVNSIACNHTDGTFSHVTSLKLKSMSLQGRLPPELVKLTFLEEIDLYQNYLSGELPKEWASMQHLNFISVTATGISGEISKEWGNFANLTYLSLEANQLSGSIPEELGNLVSLTDLALSSNQFVGSLPKTLANLTNLIDFRISDNNFSGTVPEFIGRWNKLQRLEMYSSGLEGPISSTIFALGNLTDLRITDMIGPKFDFPKRIISKEMKYLVLRNLNMSGSIPTDIWEMDKLQTLNGLFSCPSTPSCSNYQSFHINCGGQDVLIKQTLYEGDHAGNRSILNYNRQTNWGMISAGDFMDTEKNGYTLSAQTQVTQPELYSTARGSPLFLTYYGYCLENGNYKVNLHFAEIGFKDEEPYNRAGRRIFDIYIQGTLKWKDFNIKEQANGTSKAIIRTINTVVTDNTLDIRLYWAGKGTTCIPYRGYYGPLISAISVTRDAILGTKEEEEAFDLQQNGNLMEIVDPKLEDKFNKEEAERMIKVGLLCSNADPALRPTMSEAVSMLEAQITVQEVASDPSIYGHDLQIKQLKGYYQQKHDQSSSGSSAPNYFSERTGVGSSTTSAHDLYPVNSESTSLINKSAQDLYSINSESIYSNFTSSHDLDPVNSKSIHET
ncbi:hypothetical protein EZV62_027027 [Acer yangbiense]|uniref:non-specific serine/threonine protein kinase n=1 Tax=Acer yangbiense TaxID=1000413 RepID=A0A5C7GSY8_9ROSI|nr:hypothetical protein EZV62_027027 [Acer yangbiense]